jgi:hypothetical protein
MLAAEDARFAEFFDLCKSDADDPDFIREVLGLPDESQSACQGGERPGNGGSEAGT